MPDIDIDISGTKRLYEWIDDFESKYDDFLIQFLEHAGDRALKYTVENTPVGIHGPIYAMTGGTLRRAWKLKPVEHKGDEYIIILYGDSMIARYALYVEEGHRTVSGYVFQLPDGTWRRTQKGFVEGQHMSRNAVEKVGDALPANYTRSFNKFIRSLGG